jgi:uncharacterized RDD family membrane protein YckC
MNIHIAKNGKQTGPYDLEEVNRLLAAGALSEHDLAWHSGLENWQALHSIVGVELPARRDGSRPPPLSISPAVVRYAGFWRRLVAMVLDGVLVSILTLPPLLYIYGWEYFHEDSPLISGPADFLISWVFPAFLAILFWVLWQATPGKMAVSARIVRADTLGKASVTQLMIRYLGYFLSIIPLGLGFIWAAFDSRKQGWHDKLAKTVVIVSVDDASDEELR